VSPSPFEGGKPGGRGRPGMTPPPSGPREGLSPSPFERGRGRGRPGERSPEPGAAGGGAAEATRGTSPSEFQSAPPQPEHGRPPARKLRERPTPDQGGGQIPPQGRARGSETEQFGTQPGGAAERGPRTGGAPSEFRQPITPPPGGASAAQTPR